LAIAYLVLVIRQNIWCWICAGTGSAIYVWLFIGAKLYMESLLYVFYVVMAVYGWRVWKRQGAGESALPISVWPLITHAKAISIIVLLAGGCGYLLSRFSDAAFPYVDSLTTFSAIWATFLVARKVLENWWYWLVIDAASMLIYWSRDLELTALLFVIYILLIPVGLIQWLRSYRAQEIVAR
jgi:nicotinamide mononucleotide transporter